MAIVTQTMLEDRVGADELIRLTDDGGLLGDVNQDVLNRHIEEGESEILLNIGQRYTLPLQMTDSITAGAVRAKLLDAVVYRLYMHRDHRAEQGLADERKRALEWSEKVADGSYALRGELAADANPVTEGKMLIVGDDVVIDRESMKGLT